MDTPRTQLIKFVLEKRVMSKVLEINFDSSVITLEELLEIFGTLMTQLL